MPKDIDEMTNAEKYVQLFNEMQMSLAQAKTEQEKNKIRQNFERDTQDFSGTDLAKASRMIDAMREGKAKGSLLSSLEMSLEEIDDEAIVKLTGKDPSPESRKEASEILKFMSEAGEAILELDSSKRPTNRKGIAEYNTKQKELTKKVDKLKKDLGTSQFNFFKYQILRDAGRVEKNEGSLMVPPEREGYAKGSVVVDIFEALAKKAGVKKKKGMKDAEVAEEIIRVNEELDPNYLNNLNDEEAEALLSRLSPKAQARMGMADEPIEDMVEILRGMQPSEVAKNLELFNSMDEIFDYTSSLNARDAREFMENLSDEDIEIFGADMGTPQLGPREMKADGGTMAILMPAEYEEPPVDTYDNISSEEEKEEVANMLPDDEMEEEYVDYVAEEVLEPEEQEYLFKVLDEDPRLEGILDKIILNATEFAGEGEVEGPGTGISDSIPARLSDGEFVITKKATDQIGADNLQKMMDDAERAYDGGLMGMANGGEAGTNPFVNPEDMYGVPKDGEEDIERQMLYSSRMPSLMNR